MLRISLVFVAGVLAAQTLPNTMELASGSIGVKCGAFIRYKSILTWPGALPPAARGNGTGIGGGATNTVHRTLIDQTTGSSFGYDMRVEPAQASGEFIVTFLPPASTLLAPTK